MDLKNVKRIGIIGAGEAGLSTAKMLLGEGYDCVVFERSDRVGGVWTHGYLDFGLQVQHELYEVPDWPVREGTPDFTPGPMVCSYLEEYAECFGVTPRVRFRHEVVGVTERSDGKAGWSVAFRGPDRIRRSEDFDLVVVAMGIYSHTPNRPRFAGEDDFRGQVIHNSELVSREQLEGRKVVVVGYGKSATDAAVLAAEHAKEATIVFREPHWPVPPVLAGGIPFKYALFNRLTNSMLPLPLHPTRVARAWHRAGRPLIWAFWRLVEALLIAQCGLRRPERGTSATHANLLPDEPIEVDGFSNSTMLPKPEFFEMIHDGRLGAERAEVTGYDPYGVKLSHGGRAECDLVVLATGWHTDYGILKEEIRDRIGFEKDGYYLYRQMMHPDVPNLAFIGSNAATYINILTHNLQARWLTELLRGTHELPGRQAMLEEIDALKKWKRRVIPASPARAATLHLHMQSYHDTLLRDMGLSPHRKRGVFRAIKEVLAPYEPRDYAAVTSGKAFGRERMSLVDRETREPRTLDREPGWNDLQDEAA